MYDFASLPCSDFQLLAALLIDVDEGRRQRIELKGAAAKCWLHLQPLLRSEYDFVEALERPANAAYRYAFIASVESSGNNHATLGWTYKTFHQVLGMLDMVQHITIPDLRQTREVIGVFARQLNGIEVPVMV